MLEVVTIMLTKQSRYAKNTRVMMSKRSIVQLIFFWVITPPCLPCCRNFDEVLPALNYMVLYIMGGSSAQRHNNLCDIDDRFKSS